MTAARTPPQARQPRAEGAREPRRPPALTREDRLSLAFHVQVAKLLRAGPEPVVAKARANARRLARQHPQLAGDFDRWQAWLSLPPDDLCARITAETEEAIWMRHITVFAGVLSPSERNAIIRRQRAAP